MSELLLICCPRNAIMSKWVASCTLLLKKKILAVTLECTCRPLNRSLSSFALTSSLKSCLTPRRRDSWTYFGTRNLNTSVNTRMKSLVLTFKPVPLCVDFSSSSAMKQSSSRSAQKRKRRLLLSSFFFLLSSRKRECKKYRPRSIQGAFLLNMEAHYPKLHSDQEELEIRTNVWSRSTLAPHCSLCLRALLCSYTLGYLCPSSPDCLLQSSFDSFK